MISLYTPTETHRQYREALEQLQLTQKALGKLWLAAAADAFTNAVPVALPFREERFFDALTPAAFALEFTVPRGLKIKINVEADFTAYFLDIFRVETGKDDQEYILIATKPQQESILEFTPNVQGRYLVRIQPELLEEGRMLLTLTAHASLAWPIKDSSEKDIISYFGLGRDGGERVHHGLDIKAPRGREVVAVISATGRPGLNERGGNVIRLNNNVLNVMLYYAHLDQQLIQGNTELQPGAVIGTVGNTGNARTTIPHLHIGVYDRSWRTPVDPWYFLIEPHNNLKLLNTPGAVADNWKQVLEQSTLLYYPAAVTGLRKSPAVRDFAGNTLDPEFTVSFNVNQKAYNEVILNARTPVKILGNRSGFVFIEEPGGRRGYLPETKLGSLQPREKSITHDIYLFRQGKQQQVKIAKLQAGTVIEELSQYRGLFLIKYHDRVYWGNG